MHAYRRYIFLFAIYAAIALPGAIALALYHYTDNPFLQPLGLTRERLAEVEGQHEFTSILVLVSWGVQNSGTTTKAGLRDLVTRGFRNRTDDYYFRFVDIPGDKIHVSFSVGPNQYGPYPTSRIIDGINPALAALDMTKKTVRPPQGCNTLPDWLCFSL